MTQPRDTSLPDDRFRIVSEHSSDTHLIFDATGPTDRSDARVKLLKASDKAHVPAHHPAALPREYQRNGSRSIEERNGKQYESNTNER
jgi:hypothetical protein